MLACLLISIVLPFAAIAIPLSAHIDNLFYHQTAALSRKSFPKAAAARFGSAVRPDMQKSQKTVAFAGTKGYNR